LDAVHKHHLDLMFNRKTFSYINGSPQEDLSMNTTQIANLGFPTLPEHCVTRQYADRMLNRFRTELMTCEVTSEPETQPNSQLDSSSRAA